MGRWCGGVLCTLVVLACGAYAAASKLCPARCSCDDAIRAASCADAGLDVVPIQLNPEAKIINLTHNAIFNVHFTLGFYVQLIVLDLSYNKIDTLGSKNFDSNSVLTHLNLSHNAIESLDRGTFDGLKMLIELDLSFNQIAQMNPLCFKDLALLERLDLSNNKLVSFDPDTFEPLASMKILSLKNNGILDIPSSNLIYAIRLEELYLSDNLIDRIQKLAIPALRYLKHLDLNNNIIHDIDHSAFDGLPSLRHLDLSNNNVSSIPTLPLSKLSNLSHLYLSGNFFRTIPAVSFQSLFHLRHLHLSRLSELFKIDARAFVDNINLEKMWMNDNVHVSEMPARLFHGNPKLTHVFVRNNALVTLESSNFPVDRLRELQIAGNPFVCNCSILWLWTLGREFRANAKNFKNQSDINVLKIDYNEIRCAAPEPTRHALLTEVPESEIRCSSGWVVVAAVVLSISVVISVAGGVLYFMGPLKRCKGEKAKQAMNSVMINGDVPKLANGLVYGGRTREPERRDVDRYLMIGTSISNNFHSMNPPWQSVDKHPYHQEEAEENIYQQFGYETIPHHRTPEKPHIVYV